MALWSELTAEQQSTYLAYVTQMRAAQGQFHQLLNTFVELENMWNASVSPVSTALDNTEKAPNGSGLAGSVELTDSEVVSLTSHIQNALTSFNTVGHKQLRNKAAGINATL